MIDDHEGFHDEQRVTYFHIVIPLSSNFSIGISMRFWAKPRGVLRYQEAFPELDNYVIYFLILGFLHI